MKPDPKDFKTWGKFYRLPLITNAIQYNDQAVRNDATRAALPQGCKWIDGGEGDAPGYAVVLTANGPVRLEDGDWVIHGIEGDFYPCKEWAMPQLWRYYAPPEEPTQNENVQQLLLDICKWIWDDYSVCNHPDGEMFCDRRIDKLYGRICNAICPSDKFQEMVSKV